ncbi:membrane-associated kinase regulator 5 isoform X2 [Tripterygium wilfordii]|uniref:Membrane-associated kinase regulator 5 isoform X2 n=1 Tax=Tripterygium wilfordii TaxID=458696 RepID=A0A7J7CET9_TRIWF|nr:probable membrane-associated kinase regulator 5 [Tripterygium wilfordii]KAF5732397.1 membrane-associated kinase regulator 5 isoform X2 [Tripterygium wilfordii]
MEKQSKSLPHSLHTQPSNEVHNHVLSLSTYQTLPFLKPITKPLRKHIQFSISVSISISISTMEALYFLKFWKTHKENGQISNPLVGTEDDECDEGDDSFFELEFTGPDFDTTVINSKTNTTAGNNGNDKNDNPGSDSNQEPLENSAIKTPTLSVSPTETISKRKVLPIVPITKPQSSISLLKSAPKLRVLMFKNPKVASNKAEKTGKTDTTTKQQNKSYAIKFKFEESPNQSVFTTNTPQTQNPVKDDSLSDTSSKSYSKDVMHRYLKLIKPLYVKVSKRNSEKMKSSGGSSATSSPASSPATETVCSPRYEKQGNVASGFRTVSKHFRKSKSVSAAISAPQSPANRRDDSLLLQHDGIQGAIMHCKRSFNSTRDSSLLSRFTSDPLQGSSMDWPRKSNEEN